MFTKQMFELFWVQFPEYASITPVNVPMKWFHPSYQPTFKNEKV